jgi:hypothetical protein
MENLNFSLSYEPELTDSKPKNLLIRLPTEISFPIQTHAINSTKSPSRMHLWNENSKHHQSWIVFNSEEKIGPVKENSFDALEVEHMKELDAYFSSYEGR